MLRGSRYGIQRLEQLAPRVLARRAADLNESVKVAAQVMEQEESGSRALTHGPLLWVDPLYTPGVAAYRGRELLRRFTRLDVSRMDATAEKIMDTLQSRGVAAERVIQRPREGGLFVELHDRSEIYRAQNLLRSAMPELEIHQVAGRPFFEDIGNVTISRRVKVVFPEPKDAEQVYRMFRPYGAIYGIKMIDAKSADVIFSRVHEALRARYCVQNMAYPSGIVTIDHLPYSWIDWNAILGLLSSPRMIPLVALAIIGAFVFMLEPIRLFYVITTISLGQRDDIHFDSDVSALSSGYVARPELEDAFKSALKSPQGGLWIVNAPVGTGKTSFLKHLRQERKNVVYVDCRGGPLGHKDFGTFLEHMEQSIGFWPSFSAISRVLSYIESFLPSKQQVVTKTRETELEGVLETMHSALRFLRATRLSSGEGSVPVIVFDEIQDLVNLNPGASAQQRDEAMLLLRMLLKWSLAASNVYHTAHVVFASSNQYASDELTLVNEIRGNASVISLPDLSPEDTKEFLRTKLGVSSGDALPSDADRRAAAAAAEVPSALPPATAAAMAANAPSPTTSTDMYTQLDDDSEESASKKEEDSSMLSLFSRIFWKSRLSGLQWWWRSEKRDGAGGLAGDGQPRHSTVGLHSEADLRELSEQVHAHLGGRISDLDDFCRRLETHCLTQQTEFREAAPIVLNAMVSDALRRVLVRGFGAKYFDLGNQNGRPWTSVHLWKLINSVDRAGAVPVTDAVVNNLAGNEEALRGLVGERLVSVVERKGERFVVPASPLMGHVFHDLVGTRHFNKRADRMVGQADIESLRPLLSAVEDELLKVQAARSWYSSPSALSTRANELNLVFESLNKKLAAANSKLASNL